MTRIFVILSICFVHCLGTALQCSNSNPCQLQTGEPLLHPPQLLSRNGELQTTLKVQMSEVTVGGWLRIWRRTYNGKIGGPTLRVKPGDSISVNLVNTLGPNAAENSHKKLKLANSTNLYLHGLHVSLQANDPTTIVHPGKTKKYTYKIDCNHPPGTYWYHPHVQGSTMFQTISGMSGMVVVEDPSSQQPSSISSYSCPNNCDHEVHLLFQPTMLYQIGEDGFCFSRIQKIMRDDSVFRNRQRRSRGSALENWLINRANNVHYFTTNGQLQPTLRLEAGKTMRFRMVNAGGIHVLEIPVPRNKQGDHCDVQEIARDGVYLSYPQTPRQRRSLLSQGGTLDWLIRCDSPGNYEIVSDPRTPNNLNFGRGVRFRGVLARMEIASVTIKLKKFGIVAKLDDNVPTVLPPPPQYMSNLLDVPQDRIVGKFVVEAATNNLLNRQKYSSGETSVKHQMPLDSVQEWTLLNADPSNSHTLHVQGNHFQVMKHNAYVGPLSVTSSDGKHYLLDKKGNLCKTPKGTNASHLYVKKKASLRRSENRHYSDTGLAQPGQWRNTIILPPLSNITIRMVPRRYTGQAMVHSHNLLREDFGMKFMVEIVERGKAVQSGATSQEEGLPGTCNPGDFYPTVFKSALSLGKQTLVDFFSWLYKLKPVYMNRYGDQRYLSGLYGAYLRQRKQEVTDGHHLKDFFSWAYNKFPRYKAYYGDQSYLCELYDFYINKNITPKGRKE